MHTTSGWSELEFIIKEYITAGPENVESVEDIEGVEGVEDVERPLLRQSYCSFAQRGTVGLIYADAVSEVVVFTCLLPFTSVHPVHSWCCTLILLYC